MLSDVKKLTCFDNVRKIVRAVRFYATGMQRYTDRAFVGIDLTNMFSQAVCNQLAVT